MDKEIKIAAEAYLNAMKDAGAWSRYELVRS
jgi:hypothetical protein